MTFRDFVKTIRTVYRVGNQNAFVRELIEAWTNSENRSGLEDEAISKWISEKNLGYQSAIKMLTNNYSNIDNDAFIDFLMSRTHTTWREIQKDFRFVNSDGIIKCDTLSELEFWESVLCQFKIIVGLPLDTYIEKENKQLHRQPPVIHGLTKDEIIQLQQSVANLTALAQSMNFLTLDLDLCEDETYKSYDGGNYEGHLLRGKRHGQGIYSWPDGSSHSGEWANDSPNGYGTRLYSNGDKYEGSWVDNRRIGFGTYTWENGIVYVGHWNSERNGSGKMTFTNGDIFNGVWQSGKFVSGKRIVENGSAVFEGTWKNGKLHGCGKVTFDDGAGYEGKWDGGKFYEYGKMTFPTNSTFESEWVDGEPHGNGKLTVFEDDGTVVEYLCVDEEITENIKVTHPDGIVYEGVFDPHEGKSSGIWSDSDGVIGNDSWKREGENDIYRYEDADGSWRETIYFPDSTVKITYFTGEEFMGDESWLDGEGYSYGRFTRDDGAVYECDFWDCIPHGKGKFIKPDGSII